LEYQVLLLNAFLFQNIQELLYLLNLYHQKYKQYFSSDEEKWQDTFELVDEFITHNNKRPSTNSKNPDEKFLGCWIGTQQVNYKNKV
jgi:hypothetical protein